MFLDFLSLSFFAVSLLLVKCGFFFFCILLVFSCLVIPLFSSISTSSSIVCVCVSFSSFKIFQVVVSSIISSCSRRRRPGTVIPTAAAALQQILRGTIDERFLALLLLTGRNNTVAAVQGAASSGLVLVLATGSATTSTTSPVPVLVPLALGGRWPRAVAAGRAVIVLRQRRRLAGPVVDHGGRAAVMAAVCRSGLLLRCAVGGRRLVV